jgi:hypothetical protein
VVGQGDGAHFCVNAGINRLALGVGVLIEQKDITDIVQVYTNLLAASGNHLDAFMKVLERPEEGSSATRARKGR